MSVYERGGIIFAFIMGCQGGVGVAAWAWWLCVSWLDGAPWLGLVLRVMQSGAMLIRLFGANSFRLCVFLSGCLN